MPPPEDGFAITFGLLVLLCIVHELVEELLATIFSGIAQIVAAWRGKGE